MAGAGVVMRRHSGRLTFGRVRAREVLGKLVLGILRLDLVIPRSHDRLVRLACVVNGALHEARGRLLAKLLGPAGRDVLEVAFAALSILPYTGDAGGPHLSRSSLRWLRAWRFCFFKSVLSFR